MAINYVKTNWVNGQAPALSATNLNKIENGIKGACDGVDNQKKLLWENPSPSTSFTAQDITFTESAASFGFFLLVCKDGTNDTTIRSVIFPVGSKTQIYALWNVSGSNAPLAVKRDVSASTATTMSFSDASQKNTNATSGSIVNGKMIPIYVYGIL